MITTLQPEAATTTEVTFDCCVADAKSYILISQLPADVYRKYVEDVNTTHLTGFTFVILGVVHLAGGKIPEENLWHHLRRMGFSDSDEIHPVLGNVKQALEALVQQRYLQKDKVNGPEGSTLFYELAERALDAPVNDRIKEYISQVLISNPDCSMKYSIYVWQIVKKDAATGDVD
ncbi:melanoma-associated antigen d4 [Quercus suber]|uniref:Melanoma-associated antigen d4 n=1 Tax=Quercus suber TaxID=58331 RepID=A0AAW0L1F2_QUESU